MKLSFAFGQKEKITYSVVLVLVLMGASAYFGEVYQPVERIENSIAYMAEEFSTDDKRQLATTVSENLETIHIVREEEWPAKIARKYDVNLQLLLFENELSEDSIIKPGDRLIIPNQNS